MENYIYRGALYQGAARFVDINGTQHPPIDKMDQARRDELGITLVATIDIPPADPENYFRGGPSFNGTALVATYTRMSDAQIKERTNGRIDGQIGALERQQLLPRGVREELLKNRAEKFMAANPALTQGQALAALITAPTVQLPNPNYSVGFANMYAFDQQIAAMRNQRLP